MSIELHTWNTPNGRKISVALEEMGLPYSVKTINISKGEQFAPAFVKISPNSKIPAIVDPEGPGGQPISLFESGAILIYLGEKTGKFWPADLRRQVPVLEWLMWQMGGLVRCRVRCTISCKSPTSRTGATASNGIRKKPAGSTACSTCGSGKSSSPAAISRSPISPFWAGHGGTNVIRSIWPISRTSSAGMRQ